MDILRGDCDLRPCKQLYGDGERVFFWIVLPIKRGAQTIGYIAHQRKLQIGPTTQRTLRELSGDSVYLFYRNADGRFWTNGISSCLLYTSDAADD